MTRKGGGAHAPPCDHTGLEPVQVGPYQIRASGRRYLTKPSLLRGVDVLVSLNGWVPPSVDRDGGCEVITDLELPDFRGVPPNWRELLEREVIPRLQNGKTLLAYCFASHGRTGTFLASLIALLESEEQTPDPIAAVRERHCSHAVETLAQAEGIFGMRNQDVSEKYRREFSRQYQPIGKKGGLQ
jgi:hypothetical protein